MTTKDVQDILREQRTVLPKRESDSSRQFRLQDEPDDTIVLENWGIAHPIITLFDCQKKAQIVVDDDGCYVLYFRRPDARYEVTHCWPKEIVEAIQSAFPSL